MLKDLRQRGSVYRIRGRAGGRIVGGAHEFRKSFRQRSDPRKLHRFRMVGPVHLPSGVAQFVAAHIGTFEHLELLLLLMQTRERWWDASAVSATLELPLDAARRALDHLAAHNLLAIRVTGDVRYQFQPGAPALADSAALFAEAFRLNPVAVLQLIPQPSRRSIHDFATAFRLRRDDDR